MKKRFFTILMASILLFSSTAFAHSGRTDSSGGHHDYNNVSGLGSYHYHHGYGPHLHPNGVCPYSSSARSSSSSTSVKTSSTASTTAVKPVAVPKQDNTVSALINQSKVTVNNKHLSDDILMYKDKAYVPLQALISMIPNAVGMYDPDEKVSRITVSTPPISSALEREKAAYLDNNIVFLRADILQTMYHTYDCSYIQGASSDLVISLDRKLLDYGDSYYPCSLCRP